jgi:peptide/nickel transport system permease protein
MAVASDVTTQAPRLQNEEEQKAILSVRQLMWLRFKRNKLAIIGGVILVFMYLMAIFAEFVAPYGVRSTHDAYPAAPPNFIHFFDAEGKFHLQPFVYGLKPGMDPETFQRTFEPITDERYPVHLFGRGEPYKMWGLIETDRHLFSVDEPGKIFIMGTDKNARDLFSRIVHGSRVSLSVGLVGVVLSLAIGAFVGVMSGYYGGVFDNITQRLTEVLMSIPQIPLWLALAAAVPSNWSPIKVYFGIAIVLSIVNWGGLARQVRGMVLSLRETDYVVAARYTNCSSFRIIARHLLPNTASHLLVIATMSIPAMILGETSLSFLGLGIRPPMTSWGVLLNEAQHVRVFLQQPWMLMPVLFVLVTIVSFNFVGDGVRDAADPFAGG